MKRILLTTVLITAVCLSMSARKFVAEGKTYTAMGNYKIEIDDQAFFINGKEHRPYVITYENSNLEVKVAVDVEGKHKVYYVISDALSVKYVSNRQYFGVEKVDADGYKTSDAALNREEYFHQKVITSGRNWKRDNTGLIAAYYPMLLNNQENLLTDQ